MIDLSAYLRAEAERRFELGTADCCCFVADWVRLCRGIDPIAHCRGYRGRAEADALLRGWGGLTRIVGRAAARIGLKLTRQPAPGDVAVVALAGVATCAIRSAHGWILRMDDGMAMLPPDRVRVLAAWRV